MHHTRNARMWRLTAAASALAVACSDAPTSTLTPAGPSLTVVEGEVWRRDTMFVSNARKYADTGQHPAIARAGSATLSVLALLSRDGSGDVELVAGEWGGWTRGRVMLEDPPGGVELGNVQLKVADPAGTLQYARNVTAIGRPATSIATGGMMRGGRVQVQATITGADFARTGVVTVGAPVLRRPDLAVATIRRPPRAVLNSAVPIVAVVRELNGDLGAWADCVLLVDGEERDRAYGIWVDAGGTVTCALSHLFRVIGESRLEVRLERAAPRDDDATNDAATATIAVTRIPQSFYYDAMFEDATFNAASSSEWSFSTADGRQGNEISHSDTVAGRIQQSYLNAFLPRAVTFPLTELFARQYTRDETAHAMGFRQLGPDWTDEDPWVRRSCVSRGFDNLGGRGWLYLCTHLGVAPETEGLAFTSLQYDRYAGDVTYASRGHSRFWNRDLGIDDVYSWNYSGRDVVGRFVRYGLEYAFFARIVEGSRISTVNPFIGLLPFESSLVQPRVCWSAADPWGSYRSCYERRTGASGVAGWVFGEPTP